MTVVLGRRLAAVLGRKRPVTASRTTVLNRLGSAFLFCRAIAPVCPISEARNTSLGHLSRLSHLSIPAESADLVWMTFHNVPHTTGQRNGDRSESTRLLSCNGLARCALAAEAALTDCTSLWA